MVISEAEEVIEVEEEREEEAIEEATKKDQHSTESKEEVIKVVVEEVELKLMTEMALRIKTVAPSKINKVHITKTKGEKSHDLMKRIIPRQLPRAAQAGD